MDNAILKKRLNTFKAGKSGRLQEVSNDVVLSVHRAWENWPGKTTDLCRELGVNSSQLGIIIQKGKRLIKSGMVTESEFKEVAVVSGVVPSAGPCQGIELGLGDGKVIRFPSVDPLLEFLKKAA